MGYVSLADYNELLHAYANSLSTLTTAATGGIYIHGLPVGWEPANGNTVVFIESTGRPQIEVPIIQVNYQVRAYAYEPWDSRALIMVVFNSFHRRNKVRFAVTGGFGLLQYSMVTSAPQNMREPETDWNFDTMSIEVQFSENLVP